MIVPATTPIVSRPRITHMTIGARASPIVSVGGEKVDLGLVGAPIVNGTPRLLTDLLARGYVPVIACIGATRDGQLMNVNADTLASHDRFDRIAANTRAKVIIQHEPSDVAKLPAFPNSAR